MVRQGLFGEHGRSFFILQL